MIGHVGPAYQLVRWYQDLGVTIMELSDLGWNSDLEEYYRKHKKDGLIPGRVSSVNLKDYRVITQDREINAIFTHSPTGSDPNRSDRSDSDHPAVGDWVVIQKIDDLHPYTIISIFPRKNTLSRKVAGDKTEQQIIATNIDMVFIVTCLDHDFNINRLERYLAMVHEINAEPIIILNKLDACSDPHDYLDKTTRIPGEVPILTISAKDGSNVENLTQYIEIGKTIVLIGSSGVGKSTLINHLMGYSRQKVGDIRESDGKGRHVTTSRELIPLPGGGMLIDNPGIREIQLWSSGTGITRTFTDIHELSHFCKFKDCIHESEPGCAVKQAIEDGELSLERFNSYRKLMREQEYLRLKRDKYERKKQEKKLGKLYRQGENIRRLKGRE